MPLLNWLRSWSRPTPAVRRPAALRPSLEALEDRTVPTAGLFDTTFDGDGMAVGTFNSGFNAVAVQPDGKIVAGGGEMVTAKGSTQWATALARYNPNGSLDTTFGAGGKRTTDLNTRSNDSIRDIALQADGKIVVVSDYDGGRTGSDFAVQRYLANGTLDASFGSGGKVVIDLGSTSDVVTQVVVQPDGKILVAGRTTTASGGTDFALVRYLPNGVLDTSFGSGGKVVTAVSPGNDFLYALTIQTEGVATPRILAGGNCVTDGQADFAVVRYNLDGSLDSAFADGGVSRLPANRGTGYVRDLVVLPDGKILAGGWGVNRLDGSNDTCVARLLPDGTVDASFGLLGVARINRGITEWANGLRVQADGKIVLAGYSSTTNQANHASQDLFLTRLTPDGMMDPSYGAGGTAAFDLSGVADRIDAVAMQSDGKIVGVGTRGATLSTGGSSLVLRLTADSVAPNPPPAVSITNGSVTEGNGGLVALTFAVSLSQASASPVTLLYSTSGVTATPGTDYEAAINATLTFEPGETVKTITIWVMADTDLEFDETFSLYLFDSYANLLARATGTIVNDDV